MVYKKNSGKKLYKRSTQSGTTNNSMFNGNKVDITLFKRAVKDIIDVKKECEKKAIRASASLIHQTHTVRNVTGNIQLLDPNLTDKVRLLSYKGHWTVLNGTTFDTPLLTRIMVIQSKVEVQGGSDAWGSTIGTTDLYLENQTPWIVSGVIDSKKCQVLYDKTINQTKQTPNSITNTIVPFNIKLDRDFQFKPGSIYYGNRYNIYVVAFSYQQGGNTGVTNIGGLYEDSQLITKTCV